MSTPELQEMTDEGLYQELRVADRLRAREGSGRGPEVQAVKAWCRQRKRQVRAELKRRKLPTTAPGKWVGIGRGFVNGEVSA